VLSAKLMGAHSMPVILTPAELRQGLKLLSWRQAVYRPTETYPRRAASSASVSSL
jgi:hypothetical protein